MPDKAIDQAQLLKRIQEEGPAIIEQLIADAKGSRRPSVRLQAGKLLLGMVGMTAAESANQVIVNIDGETIQRLVDTARALGHEVDLKVLKGEEAA